MIDFKEMTAKEFDEYLDLFVAEYGADVQKAYQLEKEEARVFAKKSADSVLVDGQHTKGHFIYKVCDGDQYVGVIWFTEEGESLFIMDFLVFEPYRHKGYGTAILERLEEAARDKGMKKMTLYVFSWNEDALSLYRQQQFQPVRLYMEKILD